MLQNSTQQSTTKETFLPMNKSHSRATTPYISTPILGKKGSNRKKGDLTPLETRLIKYISSSEWTRATSTPITLKQVESLYRKGMIYVRFYRFYIWIKLIDPISDKIEQSYNPSPNHPIPEWLVHDICLKLETRPYLSNQEIANLLGVTKDRVRNISLGKTWTHVSCEYDFSARRRVQRGEPLPSGNLFSI